MRLETQAFPRAKSFSTLTKAYYLRFCQVLWTLGIILLPITSLPLLVRVSGASTVAPPSNLIFLVLAVVWLAPYILTRNRLPAEVKLFMIFVAVAILTWLAAFYLQVPPFKGQSMLTEGPDAFITLAMAVTTYVLTASWLARSPSNLKFTFLLINISGLLVLGWSFLQAYYIFFNNNLYPSYLYNLQSIVSSRADGLFPDRVTGLAYEPSWLAHQLNLVYLPVWLSATVMGYSSIRIRLWRLTFENILLGAGILTLFITFSRVGWLSFFCVLAYLAIKLNLRIAQKIQAWVVSRANVKSSLAWLLKSWLSLTLILVFLAAYAAALVGFLKVGSRFEPRLERFFNDPFSAGGVYEISNQLAFAERLIFWSTGWEIFNDHPFLGVGLGNAGFYFPEKIPAFGWALWEVSQVFYYHGHLPNIKSLWVRILAETGILGFTVFLAWTYLLWISGRLARFVRDPVIKMAGLVGHLVIVAFIIEGFSVDSFALPYYWFSAGILSAGAFLARKGMGRNEMAEVDAHG
jgi:O-antigen ligase